MQEKYIGIKCNSSPLLKEQLEKDTGKTVGISALERLLKDCGDSCRRPRKGVPAAAPSKKEKLARVQEIAAEILKLKKDSDGDVFLSMNHTFQQSHMLFEAGIAEAKIFSLETSRNRKSITISDAYRPQTKSFYWKSAGKSDSQAFKTFPHQLTGHCPDSKTFLVPDHASIHIFRSIKEFVKRNPDMEIFTLPGCSPAYNPAEQVWRWLKPRVCSLPHLIFFDNSDRSAFRKTCHAS